MDNDKVSPLDAFGLTLSTLQELACGHYLKSSMFLPIQQELAVKVRGFRPTFHTLRQNAEYSQFSASKARICFSVSP